MLDRVSISSPPDAAPKVLPVFSHRNPHRHHTQGVRSQNPLARPYRPRYRHAEACRRHNAPGAYAALDNESEDASLHSRKSCKDYLTPALPRKRVSANAFSLSEAIPPSWFRSFDPRFHAPTNSRSSPTEEEGREMRQEESRKSYKRFSCSIARRGDTFHALKQYTSPSN